MKELTMNDFATKREDEGLLEKEEDQCCDEENQLSLEEVCSSSLFMLGLVKLFFT
jgi:hypothetical protein